MPRNFEELLTEVLELPQTEIWDLLARFAKHDDPDEPFIMLPISELYKTRNVGRKKIKRLADLLRKEGRGYIYVD